MIEIALALMGILLCLMCATLWYMLGRIWYWIDECAKLERRLRMERACTGNH